MPRSQGRALAAQHNVTVAPPVDGPLPERQLGRKPAWRDALAPSNTATQLRVPGLEAASGRWLYFRLMAAPNPDAQGKAEWRPKQLAHAASLELGRRASEKTAAGGVAKLRLMGLVERTFNHRNAPWTLTDAGIAKAREAGIIAEDAPSALVALG